MTNIRIKPLDTNAPGSFQERTRILRVMNKIRGGEVGFLEGQLLMDELMLSRMETTDGSDLEEALSNLSAAEADNMVAQLLASEVPTESAEN